MRLIAFAARCQLTDIMNQYLMYDVRCFDLRVRFDEGKVIVAHGIVEYQYGIIGLERDLKWLNEKGDCYVRVIHEVRTERQRERSTVIAFRDFCHKLEEDYPHIQFWCGRNLYDWTYDYKFQNDEPTCEETYGSVSDDKCLYGWLPLLFAWLNNGYILLMGSDKDILLMDYVDIQD